MLMSIERKGRIRMERKKDMFLMESLLFTTFKNPLK